MEIENSIVSNGINKTIFSPNENENRNKNGTTRKQKSATDIHDFIRNTQIVYLYVFETKNDFMSLKYNNSLRSFFIILFLKNQSFSVSPRCGYHNIYF